MEMEKVFVSEHDLSAFFVRFIYNSQGYAAFKNDLHKILENLEYFEGEWSKTRYPKEKAGKVVTPTESYTSEDSAEAVEKARDVLHIVTSILVKKFNFEL